MIGQYVYKESDTDYAPADARAKLHADAVAISDYGHNCHGTEHVGPTIGGKHAGEFYKSVAPYQAPYGVIVPKDVQNLLVPVAVSSTHVGFCALRFSSRLMVPVMPLCSLVDPIATRSLSDSVLPAFLIASARIIALS